MLPSRDSGVDASRLRLAIFIGTIERPRAVDMYILFVFFGLVTALV
jgi:hypothetical protein